MRTIAIGDLHGQYEKLIELMEKLKKEGIDFDTDTMVFLGDFVDGGPDTNKLIEKLIAYKKQYSHWHFLYGNHEDLMLDALNPKHPVYDDFYLWWNQGGRQTADSYKRDLGFTELEQSLANPIHIIPPDHLVFITDLETWYEDEKYFFVHGGVHAYHTVDWAKKNMSRYEMIWERNFIPSNFPYKKKVIFGHTVHMTNNPKTNLTPWIFPNKIGIDTMHHGHGNITAVILPEEKFVSV